MKKHDDSELFTQNVDIDFDYNDIKKRVDTEKYVKGKRSFLRFSPALVAGVAALFILVASGTFMLSGVMTGKKAADIPQSEYNREAKLIQPEDTYDIDIEEYEKTSGGEPVPAPNEDRKHINGGKSDGNVKDESSSENLPVIPVIIICTVFAFALTFVITSVIRKNKYRKEE